jgi:acyl-CoA thioester hydrolase
VHSAKSASRILPAADAAAAPSGPRDGSVHWTEVNLRPTDVDDVGHVNNVIFAALTAAGRMDFITQRLAPLAAAGSDFWLVRIEIDYMRQLFYPGDVRIGTTVARIGRTSLTLAHDLCSTTEVAARATSVLVHVDKASGKSLPLPDSICCALSQRGDATET